MERLVERYLAVWNETDSLRRATLLKETFAEGATYRDPLMAGEGREQIDGLVAAVHGQFPGFVFTTTGSVDTVGDFVRFSWTLGLPGEVPVAHGTDFGQVAEGRFVEIVGFLNPAEAAV